MKQRDSGEVKASDLVSRSCGEHVIYCCGARVRISEEGIEVLSQPLVEYCPLHEALYGTRHIDAEERILVRGVTVDADTANSTLTVDLVYNDGTTKSLTDLQCASRTAQYLPINTWIREGGLRISSSINTAVEIFGIELDAYVPQKEKE